MTPETVGVFAAILFLLIAVVGGGFTVKELSVPTVPTWARVVAGALGVLFAVPFALRLTGVEAGDPTVLEPARASVEESAFAQAGETRLHFDDQPETSPESIKLVEVEATSKHEQPAVKDRVTVTFTLENVADTPFQLEYTFVGARGPDDEWKDFGESNPGRVLQPGEQLTVRSSKLVDEPGTWTFWPCYTFAGDGYCPSEWKAFEIPVGP